MFTCSLTQTALSLWINPTGSVDLEPNLLLMHDFKRIKLTCCCSSRLRVRELIVQTVLLVKYDVLSIDVGVYSCQGCDLFFVFVFLLLFFSISRLLQKLMFVDTQNNF